MNTFI